MGADNYIVQQIKNFNEGRQKEPLKIKYRAMAESPFRFFRGSCNLFYAKLFNNYPFPASPTVWACGDLHIENFGSYKGGNRLVYFDINDFDEAVLAPALWEVGRLAASVQLAAIATGFSKKDSSSLVTTLLLAYRHFLQKGKPQVIEQEISRGLIKKMITRVADRKEMDLVKKRTDKSNPDKLLLTERLLPLQGQEKKSIIRSFNHWLTANNHGGLQAVDAGFRIAGTGSIGVKRYVLLLAWTANPRKKILVDVKQAMAPAGANYTATPQPAWQHTASRIISVQEMMEHVAPAFLSSFQYNENWFVVKELQPAGDKVNLLQNIKPEQLRHYLSDLSMLTASAQLRSSGRLGAANADALTQFAVDDSWIEIVTAWSGAYAQELIKEYDVYRKAWQNGLFNK